MKVFIIIFFPLVNSHLNCHIFDSINVTGGNVLQNGSWLHEGLIYPPGQYEKVDHFFQSDGKRVDTNAHVRGCVCTNRICVNVCCSMENDSMPEICPAQIPNDLLISPSYHLSYGFDCKQMVYYDFSYFEVS